MLITKFFSCKFRVVFDSFILCACLAFYQTRGFVECTQSQQSKGGDPEEHRTYKVHNLTTKANKIYQSKKHVTVKVNKT